MLHAIKSEETSHQGAHMSPDTIKAHLCNQPDDFYHMFTFGQLKVGDKFIEFPTQHSDGTPVGLTGVFPVFTKTAEHISGRKDVQYTTPHGAAASKMRTFFKDFPHTTLVIRVV